MGPVTEVQLRTIVDRHGGGLALFARQWCSSPDDALQEALIDLAKLDQAPENAVAWLFQVIRHKALSQSRSEKRRANYQNAAADLRPEWFEPDPSLGLDSQAVTEQLLELPDVERQVVTSRVWGELSFAEIAELVDRPVSTVFRIYNAAIAKMRVQLRLPEGEQPGSSRKKDGTSGYPPQAAKSNQVRIHDE